MSTRRRRGPVHLARRGLARWWEGLFHDGISVLGTYVFFYTVNEEQIGKAPGHPERLVTTPLSAAEKRLWAELRNLKW